LASHNVGNVLNRVDKAEWKVQHSAGKQNIAVKYHWYRGIGRIAWLYIVLMMFLVAVAIACHGL
jgi:hypothetical protein